MSESCLVPINKKERYAIWFAGRSARTIPKRGPLPGAPLSTKYGRQSTEGGARGGRLSVDGACNQESDGDTRRRDSDLDRFGPSDRRNTLRPVSLVCCIEYMMSSRGPLPLLIYSGGAGLQVKYPIWYYTMSCGARRAAPCTP